MATLAVTTYIRSPKFVMRIEEALEILNRYKNGQCTDQERLLVEKWYEAISLEEELPAGEIDMQTFRDNIWSKLKVQEEALRPPAYRLQHSKKFILKIAAAIFIIFAAGALSYYTIITIHDRKSSPQSISQVFAPATSKAILTLANGEEITLDQDSRGDIAKTHGITIKKTAQGIIYTLTHDAAGSGSAEQVNTITTPKGGQYQLVLQDGTRIWLNAGTKITYPISFAGKRKREVTLVGEAYFEVAKNPLKPFSVRSTDQLVEVVGTHFDVSCYIHEPLQTTLAEGSIVVSQPTTGKKKLLRPGQKSIVTLTDGILIKEVNPADEIAWKDDLFAFVQTPLSQVLAEIGRWYNVDIDYSNVPNEKFEGEISRKITLPEVLHVLEMSMNIKFKTEGRRIMVKN